MTTIQIEKQIIPERVIYWVEELSFDNLKDAEDFIIFYNNADYEEDVKPLLSLNALGSPKIYQYAQVFERARAHRWVYEIIEGKR